jgi:FAD/FMN-containing dehydrogenase
VQRVGADETAFAYRDVDYAPVIAGMWEDPADNDANITWVRSYYDALQPYSVDGGYVNFMDADDQDRVKASYRGNYDRLAAIKQEYDPTNLFRLNQNVQPAH